jgi:hypothetical protein
MPALVGANLALRKRQRGFAEAQFIEEKALAGGKEGAGGSCYDLARDLAGKVKGLPKDLAANPAYLKGFGK